MISPIQSDVCPVTAASVDATSPAQSSDAPFAALLAGVMQPATAPGAKPDAASVPLTDTTKTDDSDDSQEAAPEKAADKDEPSDECISILACITAPRTAPPPVISLQPGATVRGASTKASQNVDLATNGAFAPGLPKPAEIGTEQALSSNAPSMSIPIVDADQRIDADNRQESAQDSVPNTDDRTNPSSGKERCQRAPEHHRGLPLQQTPPTLPATASTNKVAQEFDPAGGRTLPNAASDAVPVQPAVTSRISPESAPQTPLPPQMAALPQGIAQAVQTAKPITSKSANSLSSADAGPAKTRTSQSAEQPYEKNADSTAQHELNLRMEIPVAATSGTPHPIVTPEATAKSLFDSANPTRLETHANGPDSALASPVAKEALPDDAVRGHEVIQSARILDRLGHSEMQVGINTEMGRVDIHTVVRDTHVAASFAVERSELGAMLTADMPALESALTRNHLDLSGASVGSYPSGTTSGDSGQQQRQTSPHNPWTQASTPASEHDQESKLNMIAVSSPRYSSGGLNVHA